MGLVHIVMISFKEEVTPEQVEGVNRLFLALKDQCVRAESETPYITNQMAGKDISVENKAGYQVHLGIYRGGFTHVYVTQFDNEEDRDYYLRKDAAHAEFGKIVGPLFESAQVNDFVPGAF
ncbi:Major facilitator superfamily domain general substrate transporter [Penicillium expansum]|nr:Major facilitator superfamily domain general substrate transporter [Penicillium expansum]